MKRINSIKGIVSVAMFSFLLLTVYSCNNEKKEETSETHKPVSMLPEEPKDDGQGVGKHKNDQFLAIDDAMAKKGEALFTTKCTACHKTTTEKVLGPGLKGVTTRRSASWIMNMITNPKEMTEKDPTAKQLFETHNKTQMTFQDVSDEQAHEILQFLQKNDAE